MISPRCACEPPRSTLRADATRRARPPRPRCRCAASSPGRDPPTGRSDGRRSGLVANARALAAKTIGRFEIKSQLGEGGMGTVLLAVDPLLGRKIALKILHRGAADDHAKRRLMREAQGIAQVTHDNVIVVHEVGTHEDQVFVAMEYVRGGTLTRWQNDHRTLAPEQHLGQALDARADQFAFYEALYKQPPFAGESYRVEIEALPPTTPLLPGHTGSDQFTPQP